MRVNFHPNRIVIVSVGILALAGGIWLLGRRTGFGIPAGASDSYGVFREIASDLTSEQVNEYEEQLKKDPDNFELRYRLLAYYSLHTAGWDGPDYPAARIHGLWMIRNHPGAPFAGEFMIRWGEREYAEARALWLRSVELFPNDPSVLGNAGMFCFWNLTEDRDRAELLLLRAHRLEPANPKWSQALGRLYCFQYSQLVADAREASTTQDADPSQWPHTGNDNRSELAAKAVTAFDQALRCLKERPQESMLNWAVRSALRAGDSAKADFFAGQLLDYSVEVMHTPPDAYVNAAYLGIVAMAASSLHKGDLNAAEAQLLRLTAVTNHGFRLLDSETMNIADALFRRGRKEAVVEFLKRGQRLSKAPRFGEWIAQIESGDTPRFNTHPWY